MFECPNCSGNIKFDIASQMMKCGYCDYQVDPYEIDKQNEAEVSTDFDVTVFTCPQCSGEIFSMDNTAASFCSFCGSSTVLSSRISKEKRPSYIIPFAKTKEDCKTEYSKLMKRALFAPKELKDKKHIDSFRGIYMPYWVYYIKQQGHVSVKAEKNYRKGDYRITDHYNISGNIDCRYKGLAYDASSSFEDNISEKLAPFDVKNMKDFTASYLSGFYADTSDVNANVYVEDAERFAVDQTTGYVDKQIRGYELSNTSFREAKNMYNTVCEAADTAMFPVWFLSYRNGDRVAYATVNGQTGKVVADLPVDIMKYTIGSFLLAIPICILLNLFFTVTPKVLLAIVSFIAAVVAVIHSKEIKDIVKKDNYEDDKGMIDKKKRTKQTNPTGAQPEMAATQEKKKEKKPMNKTLKTTIIVMSITVAISFVLPMAIVIGGLFDIDVEICLAILVAGLFTVFSFVNSNSRIAKLGGKDKISASLYCLIAIIIALIIAFIGPVHDAFYYVGAMIALVATFITLVDLIKKYNVLSTRRLPQFDYRGGDDNA